MFCLLMMPNTWMKPHSKCQHMMTGLMVNNVPVVILMCASTQMDEESSFGKIGFSLYRVSKMRGDLAQAFLTRKMELEAKLAEKILEKIRGFDEITPKHLIEWISDGYANDEITNQ